METQKVLFFSHKTKRQMQKGSLITRGDKALPSLLS